MGSEKNAIVLFTKAPAPGATKTRLTVARGGILTPEEAAEMYEATCLDVADVARRALEDCRAERSQADGHEPASFDFILSCSSESDRARLAELFQADGRPGPAELIVDRGNTFDEHFNDCFAQLFARGYHSVVVIGGDLPVLRPYHIQSAFQWLAYLEAAGKGALVLAPCQDCGVSLVGVTAGTPIDFSGVFYNVQGISALEKIVSLCAEAEIPIAMLDQISDIDTVGDLAHAVSLLRAMQYASYFQPDWAPPRRFQRWIERTGITVTTPPNAEHDPRELIDGIH